MLSLTETQELVTVKDTVVEAARFALCVVMVPHGLLSVTPVALLVSWVTAPPAPAP
jgi:hypothetical protein